MTGKPACPFDKPFDTLRALSPPAVRLPNPSKRLRVPSGVEGQAPSAGPLRPGQ